MPRSYGVVKTVVWEPQSDFRKLSVTAQWAYVMLISQPQISNLGVLAYTPEKWRRFAAGFSSDDLDAALTELDAARYTITDEDTGELLVRTFIKHDKVWSQWQLVSNARKLIHEVESDRIRDYLTGRHPWLVEDWAADCPSGDRKQRLQHEMDAIKEHEETPLQRPLNTPLERGVETPVEQGVSPARAPARSRAGAGPGVGVGEGALSSSRTSEEEAVTSRAKNDDQKPAAAEPTDDTPPADHEVEAVVKHLRDSDSGSMQSILPLARSLPTSLFRTVLAAHDQRIQNGRVGNHTGLLIHLLRTMREDHQAKAAAQSYEAWLAVPLADKLALDARFYARIPIPWDASRDLLELKIRREAPDDDHQELLEHAHRAYREELDREPVVSSTA